MHGSDTYISWSTSISATTLQHDKGIHLRSLDSNNQAGPSWERPGYKVAKRALPSLRNAEGQGVPYILVSIRTRQNNKLDLVCTRILGMVKFSLGGVLCGTAKIIIIFKLVTKPNMVVFVILGKLAEMALTKSCQTKGKKDTVGFTLQKASGNSWRVQRCPCRLVF